MKYKDLEIEIQDRNNEKIKHIDSKRDDNGNEIIYHESYEGDFKKIVYKYGRNILIRNENKSLRITYEVGRAIIHSNDEGKRWINNTSRYIPSDIALDDYVPIINQNYFSNNKVDFEHIYKKINNIFKRKESFDVTIIIKNDIDNADIFDYILKKYWNDQNILEGKIKITSINVKDEIVKSNIISKNKIEINNSKIIDSKINGEISILDSYISKTELNNNSLNKDWKINNSEIENSIFEAEKIELSINNCNQIEKLVVKNPSKQNENKNESCILSIDNSKMIESKIEISNDSKDSKLSITNSEIINNCEILNFSDMNEISSSEISGSKLYNYSIKHNSKVLNSNLKFIEINEANNKWNVINNSRINNSIIKNGKIEHSSINNKSTINIKDDNFIEIFNSDFDDVKISGYNLLVKSSLLHEVTGFEVGSNKSRKSIISETILSNLFNQQIIKGEISIISSSISGKAIISNNENERIEIISSLINQDSIIANNSKVINSEVKGNSTIFLDGESNGNEPFKFIEEVANEEVHRIEILNENTTKNTVKISGYTKIYDKAKINNMSKISGFVNIYGESEIDDEPTIYGRVNILDDARVSGKAKIYKEEIINKYDERYE